MQLLLRIWTLNDGIPDVVPRNINGRLLSLLHQLCAFKRNNTLHLDQRRGQGFNLSGLETNWFLFTFAIFPQAFDAGSLASRNGTGHAQGQEHEGLKTQDKRLKAEGEGNNDQQVQRCNAAVLAAAVFTKKEHTNAAAASVDTSRDDKQDQRLKAADRASAVITTEVPASAAAAHSLRIVAAQTRIGNHKNVSIVHEEVTHRD